MDYPNDIPPLPHTAILGIIAGLALGGLVVWGLAELAEACQEWVSSWK